jgi:CarD family transcriptional regulator
VGGAEELPAHWNHRLKYNQEKLRTGEISRVSEVVRDLNAYGGERGLSTGERNLLAKARRILVSEVAMCKDVSTEEAEEIVDGALGGGKGSR